MLRASLLWSQNFTPKQQLDQPSTASTSTTAADGKSTKIAKTFLEQHVFDDEDDALSEDALKEVEKIVGPRIRVEEELRQTKDFRQFLRLLEKHQESGRLDVFKPSKQKNAAEDAASRFASIFGYTESDIDAPPSKQQKKNKSAKTSDELQKESIFGNAANPVVQAGSADASAQLTTDPPKFDVCDITVDVDGKFIVAALGDSGIAFVDAATGQASIKNHVHPTACVAVDFCRNSEQRFQFASADFEGFVYIWRPMANASQHSNAATAADLSASKSSNAATPIYNRPSQIMQLKKGRLIKKIVWSPTSHHHAHSDEKNISTIATMLAVCGGEQLIIWNETQQKVQCEYVCASADESFLDAIWSADGRMVLACLVSGQLIWIDCTNGELIRFVAVSDRQCPLMSLTLCVMQIAGLDKRPHSVVCTVDFLGNMCAIDVNTGTLGFSRQLGNFLPIDIKWCPLSKLFFLTGSTMSVYAFSLDGSYVGKVVDGENSFTLRMCLLPSSSSGNTTNALHHQQQNCLAYTTGNGCLKLLSYSADAAYSFTPMSNFGGGDSVAGGPLFVTRVGYVNIKVAAPGEPFTFGIPLGEAVERVAVSRTGLLAVLTLERVWVWQIVRTVSNAVKSGTSKTNITISGGQRDSIDARADGSPTSRGGKLDHVKRMSYVRPDTLPAPGEMGGIILFGDHFVVVLRSRVDLLAIADGRLDRYWEFEPNIISAVKLCQTGAASSSYYNSMVEDGQSDVNAKAKDVPTKNMQKQRNDGCFLVGLYDGRIYKLFLESDIQLLLVKSTAEKASPPKMLDLSILHQRLAVLHQNGELFIYDVSCSSANSIQSKQNSAAVRRGGFAASPLLLLKEVGVHSVVWSYDHECLLTYTRSNTIFWNFVTLQGAELRPQHKQITTQTVQSSTTASTTSGSPAHVLSFRNGTLYYAITTALRLESVPIDCSDLTRQLIERRLFTDAFRLATICGSSAAAAAASNTTNQINYNSVVIEEWRRFAQDCLLAMQLPMAVRINTKLRDAQTGFLIDFLASSAGSDEHAVEVAKALATRQQQQKQSDISPATTVPARRDSNQTEASPQNAAHTVVLLAYIHAFQGRFFEAARLFRRANRHDLVYEMYSDLEMYEQALQVAQEMPNAEQLKTELVNKHAQVVLARGEYERAVDLFFNVGDIPRAVKVILDDVVPISGTAKTTNARAVAVVVGADESGADDAATKQQKILGWAQARLSDALQQIQPLRMYAAATSDDLSLTFSTSTRDTFAGVLVRIGQFFEQQQQWSQALGAFEKAGDMPSIIRVQARKGDWDYLLKLVQPSGGNDDDDDVVLESGPNSGLANTAFSRRSVICRNVFVPYAIEMSNRGQFFEAQKALFEARLFDEAEQIFADPLMRLTLERRAHKLASRLYFERTRQLLRRIVSLHKRAQQQQVGAVRGAAEKTTSSESKSSAKTARAQLVDANRKYIQHRSLAQIYYCYSIVEAFVRSSLYRLGALHVMPATRTLKSDADDLSVHDDAVIWLNELFVTNQTVASLTSVYHSSRFLLNEIMPKYAADRSGHQIATERSGYDGVSYSIVVAAFVGTSYLLRLPVVAAKLFKTVRRRLVFPAWLGDTVFIYASRLDVQLLGMKARTADSDTRSGNSHTVIAPFVCPRCHITVPPLTPDVGNCCSNCRTAIHFSVMPVTPLPLIEFRARSLAAEGSTDLEVIMRALQDSSAKNDEGNSNQPAAQADPFVWHSAASRRTSGPVENCADRTGDLNASSSEIIPSINSLAQLKTYVTLRRLVVVSQVNPLPARFFYNNSESEHFTGFRCESLQCKVVCCPRCGSFFLPSDIEYVKWHALTAKSTLNTNSSEAQPRQQSRKWSTDAERASVKKAAAISSDSNLMKSPGHTMCALCSHRWDFGDTAFVCDPVSPQGENINLDDDAAAASFTRNEDQEKFFDFFRSAITDKDALHSGDPSEILSTKHKT